MKWQVKIPTLNAWVNLEQGKQPLSDGLEYRQVKINKTSIAMHEIYGGLK